MIYLPCAKKHALALAAQKAFLHRYLYDPQLVSHNLEKLRHAQDQPFYLLLVSGCLVSNGHVSLLHNITLN